MKRQVVLLHPGYFSLGLISVGTFLESNGYEVSTVRQDAPFFARDLERVLDERRCLAVGATAMTPNIASAMRAAAIVKQRFPKVPLILGGNHVTALPEETLRASAFDIGVVGEGEHTALEVLRSLEKGTSPLRVPGSYEKLPGGEIAGNGCRALVADLSSLPQPRYSLFEIQPTPVVRDTVASASRGVYLMVSRGCPYSCAFCGSELIWRRKLRFFPVEQIVAAIESLVEEHHLDSISFLDDELLSNAKYLAAFCDALTRKGLHKRIIWECQARVNTVTAEKIAMIREAGCQLIRFGMESGSPKILSFLKKNTITVEQCYEAARLCRSNGLRAFGSFIIGSPDETLDDVLGTVDLIETSGLEGAAVFTLVPYPGTDLYTLCKNEGLLRGQAAWGSFMAERFRADNIPRFVVRNRHFSETQLLHIARYVDNHVVGRLNHGLPPKRGAHRENLERIAAGEYRLASPDFDVTVRRQVGFARFVYGALRAQERPVHFLYTKLVSQLARARSLRS